MNVFFLASNFFAVQLRLTSSALPKENAFLFRSISVVVHFGAVICIMILLPMFTCRFLASVCGGFSCLRVDHKSTSPNPDNDSMFVSEKGAKSRMGYGCQGQECKIKQVKVTLIDK